MKDKLLKLEERLKSLEKDYNKFYHIERIQMMNRINQLESKIAVYEKEKIIK